MNPPETYPVNAADFWFINPAYSTRIESLLARGRAPSSEILSKRPEATYWGDSIERMRMDGSVAIIPVKGVLVKGAQASDKKLGGITGYEDVHEDLDAALQAKASGIVLDIGSPGGSAVGAGELGRHVASIVESGTPVYSFTDSMQCSAAEYLSGACSYRFATSDAIVGSIGTILCALSFEGMLKKFGIKAEVITSGPYKGAPHPLKDLTKEQLDYLQEFVNTLAGEFKAFMGAYRKSLAADSMQGQIFTGRQGVSNGLIDATASSLGQVMRLVRKD